jgi:protein-S-isoprenylcysteine O-methyltransferase Ste14
MIVIYFQFIGCGIFFVSTIVLGILLRSRPSKATAEKISKIIHFFHFFLFIPIFFVPIIPAVPHYDVLLGIPQLPFRTALGVAGAVFISVGIFFMAISILAQNVFGKGQFAFVLTKKVIKGYLYKLMRNPMSLGFYLLPLGLGLLPGSTYYTLFVLLVFIPAHIFYLKFFEEKELELRFGQPYIEYKKRVPFLIPNFRNISITEPGNHDV